MRMTQQSARDLDTSVIGLKVRFQASRGLVEGGVSDVHHVTEIFLSDRAARQYVILYVGGEGPYILDLDTPVEVEETPTEREVRESRERGSNA